MRQKNESLVLVITADLAPIRLCLDQCYGEALSQASRDGREEIVLLLLQNDKICKRIPGASYTSECNRTLKFLV
jgi:hypothetical protein